MKSILLFILIIPTVLHAQDVSFKWAKQMVGYGLVDLGTAVAVDKHGNIYTTGRFCRTADFDPGPGVFNLTRPFIGYNDFGYDDMFVLKLDAAGNFIWAKQIAANEDYKGTEVASIALDMAGNIYTTGFFYGTIDFDPGPCTYSLSSKGNGNAFILKLSSEGDFIWVKEMIPDTNSYSSSNLIALDELGNIYTTGHFEGTVDFDPGTGVYNLTATGQSPTYYSQSMFISKLDSSGNFIWAKQMEGSGENFSEGLCIAIDRAGNLFTTGSFHGSIDFDPGPDIYNLSAIGWRNSFISKLDANGSFIWAKKFTGNDTSLSWSRFINIDMSGNCIITGGFYGTVDFDPGANAFNLTSTLYGGDNFFVSKLDSAGNFIWAKRIGGTGNSNSSSNVQCASAALDTLGNIYSTGYFYQTVDFDPDTGAFNFSTGLDSVNFLFPAMDMFISKLNPDGNFTWAKQIHTTGGSYTRETYPSSIKLDTYGNIYISGGFLGTTDFDPGTGNYNLSSPTGNIFVYKMDACINSTSSTLTVVDCKSYTLNGHTYTSSGGYTQTILNTSGCDSIISLNLTINRVDTIINITACNSFTHCRTYNNCTVCYTFDSSGVYTDTLATANGCDSLVHMNITIGSFRMSFYDTACNSYSWNSQTFTSSGSYIDTLVASNGCDSIVTLNLIINTVAVSAQPQSVNLCAGSNHTFSVTATGTNIGYQWQLSTDGGLTFTDITGANTSSYTVLSIIATQNGYNYRCLVTSGCNEVISSIAVLTVITPVVITSQPVNIEICSGTNVIFSVSGSSSQTISYQWQVSTNAGASYFPITNNEVYSGATTPTLMIARATVALNIHHYRCLLSNGTCTVATISNGAILTVHELPNVELIAAPFTSLLPWQSTTLSATPVASGGILSTTWLYNNAIVPNAGNTRTVNFDQLGTYQVRIRERWPSDFVCSNQSGIDIISATGTSLFIYPNPNDGHFKISYYNSGGVSNLQTVTVYDSKGARVYNAKFTITGVYALINIDITRVAAGFYSIAVADVNGDKLAIGKLIIIH